MIPATETACSVEIEPEVAALIRTECIEGLNRVPHGGVEVGGVLFGSREGAGVRVAAAKAVPCEYASGPAYHFSASDHARFREAVAAAPAGMTAVGWYHSHTRTGPDLTAPDRAVFETYFPEAWQVALVVQPANFKPTRAVIFTHAGSAGEMSLEPVRRTEPAAAAPAAEPAAPPVEKKPEQPRPQQKLPEPQRAEEPWPAPRRPKRRRQTPLVVWAVAAVLAMVAGGVASWVWLDSPAPVSAPPLALTLVDASGQLLVSWSGAAQDARDGWLEFEDSGRTTRVRLTPEQLLQGSLTYARRSRDVNVRLRVNTPGAAQETLARFVEPEPPERPTPAASSPPPAGNPPEPEPEAESGREAREAVAPKPFQAPAPRSGTAAQAEIPAPPQVRASTAAPLEPALPDLQPPPKPEPAPRAAPTPIRSGRILWTGRLGGPGVLELQEGRASTGSLTSALPGVPVDLRVYPAEFIGDVLTFYTSDPRYRTPTAEAPSAFNGWNKAQYVWDPAKAQQIVVLERPGPANGWRRLRLRSQLPRLALLMVEWRTRQDEPTAQ